MHGKRTSMRSAGERRRKGEETMDDRLTFYHNPG
jgi:hypothetical protein